MNNRSGHKKRTNIVNNLMLIRFIKVFWHTEKGHVKERLGQHNNANMVLVHGDRLTKTVVNEEASTTEVCILIKRG